jgi:hypothetical protein
MRINAPSALPTLRSTPPAAPAKAAAVVAKPVLSANETRAKAEQFFAAFGKKDLKALEAMYRPDAKFHDDMFDLSSRDSIMKMWGSAPPFETFRAEVKSVTPGEVRAKWVVDYEMFGNKVHNEIESVIRFDAQGRIVEQREDWDESKWMKQALPAVPRWAQGIAYHFMRPILSWKMGG